MESRFGDTYLQVPAVFEHAIGEDVRLLALVSAKLSVEADTTLANISKACGLEYGVATQVVVLEQPQALGLRAIGSSATRMVSFGLGPAHFGLQIELTAYQWLTIGGQKWCFAERLELIDGDMERKRKLWNCLKELKV